jgi:4-amino-4-deoxy-L-arabinose transferase-like glycosyltransferase
LFLVPRFAFLSADPPDNLSVDSCSEYGDPGNYAFNARNKAVLGDWKIRELGAAPASPIPHIVTYLSFALFGTGIGSMNLVPIFFCVLLWFALWKLSSREFPEAQAVFFLFLAFNYAFGSFSRINDQVMPMTFFVVAALIFYLRAWGKPRLFFPAAVLLAGAFLSKPKVIYVLLIVLPISTLLVLLERKELGAFRLNAVRLAWFAGGALAVAVPWYVLVFRRYPEVFLNVGGINAEHMFPNNVGQALSYWILKPPFSFYPSNRVLTVVLFFALAVLLFAVFRRRGRARIGALEIFCVTWTVAGLGVQAFIGYRPVRHYIEFTIPILILVSLFLSRLLAGTEIDLGLKKRGWIFAGLFVLYLAAASSLGRRFLTLSPLSDLDQAKVRLFFGAIAVALVLAAASVLVLTRFKGASTVLIPKTAAVALTLIAAAVYAGQNIAKYVEWLAQPSWNLRTIGRDLGAAFPDGVFSGLLVPSLSLENRAPAHTAWPSYANDDPAFLKRAGVTHLFVGTYNNEPAFYASEFPEETKRARLAAQYRMWRSWFLLYDLRPAAPLPQGTEVFEAEALAREPAGWGMPRFDPRASGRMAFRSPAGPPSLVGRVPVAVEEPGMFRGSLIVKTEGPRGERAAALVRLLHKGGIAVERRLGIPEAGAGTNGYVRIPFSGEFMENGSYTLELRVSGRTTLWIDRIEMIR